METKQIEDLESYFKTENLHWNKYIFEMLCKVLQDIQFENPETPLQLYSKAIEIFSQQYENPLNAIEMLGVEAEKANLSTIQKVFVYEWVSKYLKDTDFENVETNKIKELLRSYIKKLRAEISKTENSKPLTENIRDTLKQLVQNEFISLSETLKELEPVQRLNILCKLIPFVLPRVESVSLTQGEPGNQPKAFQW